MFKKSSKRNLRQRKEDTDEENEEKYNNNGVEAKNANGASVASLKEIRKKKVKDKKQAPAAKPEKKSLLSFGSAEEEEDAEVFQLKKSSRSRRIAKQIKKLAQEEREKSSTEVAGQYSKEYLEELKRASTAPQSLQSSASSRFSNKEEDNNERQSESQSTLINGGFSDLRPGEIPDAHRIHAARKQREMMRKYGADYIPVDNTETVKKVPNSRLVREDELDGSSGEEDGPSVAMKGIIDDGVRVAEEIGSGGEGPLHRDEEFDLWEAEMIKKGISTQQPGKWGNEEEGQGQQFSSSYQYSNSPYSVNGTYSGATPTASITSATTKAKSAMSPSETVADVKRRIKERLECLQQVHRAHQQDAERNKSDVTESETSAVNLGDITSLSKRYTYFQDMRAYVRDLIDCLNEKVIEIDALEKRRHKIWKDRADMFVTRRQQDIADESSDITSSLSNGKQAPPPADVNKQTRVREREARRSRRRSARVKAGIGTQKSHIDGMSTDEEETSMDKAKFGAELESICKYKDTIFEDVVEEFYDVQIILSRFLEWKEKYPDSYNDAYIGLCVPRVLAPFVRLAMLHWNPLEKDCMHFEEMKWFEDLLFYGVGSSSDTEPVSGDSDNKVLSILFEKVVLPKLTTIVQDVWDPMSREKTHQLCILICRLVRSYPCMRSENRRCNELLLALCARFQRTIDNDIFIPLYPTHLLTDTASGPGAFFERQTWACIKLFENILICNGVLSHSALYELAFTSLLNRYVMLSLQTSPVTTFSVQKCQRIFDAIPSEWLKEENVNEVLPHLASFSRYLLHSAKHIHSQMSSLNDSDKRKARGCISQLGKLLSQMSADDMSNQVLELLGLKALF